MGSSIIFILIFFLISYQPLIGFSVLGLFIFFLFYSTQSLKLYKIPGSFVFGFFGEFGTGKSLAMTEQALRMANAYQLRIVANFRLNPKACRRYCRLSGLKWAAKNLVILYKPDIQDLINSNNAVLCLDEAGIHMFSRSFKDKKNQQYLQRLFKCRHYGSYLFFTCQDANQVDIQFRQRTQTWIYCSGFQRFSVKFRRSKLYSRSQFAISHNVFEQWLENGGKNRFIYSLRLSKLRFQWSPLILMGALYEILGLYKFISRVFPRIYSSSVAGAIAYNHSLNLSPPLAIICYSFKLPELFLINLSPAWQNWRKYKFRPADEYLLFDCYPSFDIEESRPSRLRLARSAPADFSQYLSKSKFRRFIPPDSSLDDLLK